MNNFALKALGVFKKYRLFELLAASKFFVDLIRANIRLLFSLSKPKFLFVGRGSKQQGIRYMQLGNFSRLATLTRLTAWPDGKLEIGRNFSLGDASIIENGFNFAAQKGEITIGDNVGIGAFSFISCPSSIHIGSDCLIGQYFSVHAQNHVFSGKDLIRHQGTTEQGVVIGSNCWIGAKVTILDGVNIGSGSVIAAGAVVTRSFPERSVIGGCPARTIRNN